MNLLVGFIAFVSEYLDSALGMGYGTALAPILILLGYSPLAVVPAILISQFFTDIVACYCHHQACNVDLRLSGPDFKIAFLLGLLSAFGVVISVIVALKIPKWFLTFYIGCLVTSMGVLILTTSGKKFRFSWPKIAGIGLLAAFNKGISGGGYGPLLMGGQILSGVKTNNAVGITAFAEAMTCLAGFLTYLILGKTIDWGLTGLLLISAVPAVPFAALTVRQARTGKLKKSVAILMIILGLLTFLKIG
jgi:uncharacterized membrane protein YfcA